MNTRGALAALVLLCLGMALPVRADTWALLIGINDYEDRNHISSLGTADQDAKALQKLLIDALKVPERNIDLLTSDGTIKPTRANIIEALSRLKKNVKEGDIVYVFFSGHGIRVGVDDYLLPHDFRGADADTGKDTALQESRFYEILSQVKARAVILTWDKCRNDPFGKSKGVGGERNTLSEDVEKRKGWVVVPANGNGSAPQPKNAPPILVKFFACSPGQSAYEWRAQGRGYFSYFFEKGLRGAAADTTGKVTVASLKKYVETEVQAQVMRDESEDQTPYPEIIGPGADDFVLTGTPSVTPEGTPVNVAREPAPEPAPPADLKKEVPQKVARFVMETNVPDLKVSLNGGLMLSGITETIFKGKRIIGVIRDFKVTSPLEIEVEATAPGYEPYRVRMPLHSGTVTLARFTDPALPKITTLTRALSQPEMVNKLLEAHKLEALAALGSVRYQINPPRARKGRVLANLDFLLSLNDPGSSVLAPFCRVLVAMRDGKASYAQKGDRLIVTTEDQTWQIETDKENRIDRLIFTPKSGKNAKPMTLRMVKYQDFEGVPLPSLFQSEINGKNGIFRVKSITRE
jgi:uncharacterized caspase-like protein